MSVEFREILHKKILSIPPLLWLQTREESRALEEIKTTLVEILNKPKYAKSVFFKLAVWSETSGLSVLDPILNKKAEPLLDRTDLFAVLSWLRKINDDVVVVLRDLDCSSRQTARLLKDFYVDMQPTTKHSSVKTIIVTSVDSCSKDTIGLDCYFDHFELALPTKEEFIEKFSKISTALRLSWRERGKSTENSVEKIEEKIRNIADDNLFNDLVKNETTMQEFEGIIAYRLLESAGQPIGRIMI